MALNRHLLRWWFSVRHLRRALQGNGGQKFDHDQLVMRRCPNRPGPECYTGRSQSRLWSATIFLAIAVSTYVCAGGTSSDADSQGRLAGQTSRWSYASSTTNKLASAGLSNLDCFTTKDCILWNSNTGSFYTFLASTHDDGGSWQTEKVAGILLSVSCLHTGRCVAVGASAQRAGVVESFISRDGGSSWALGGSLGPKNPGPVACGSSNSCVELGQAPFYTDDGATAWQESKSPPMLSFGFSVTCPSANWCIAVAESTRSQVFITSNGGRDWTSTRSPGYGWFPAVSCIKAGSCTLIGGPNHAYGQPPPGAVPVIVRTTDGGTTWQRNVIRGISQVSSGVCASNQDCLAFGSSAVVDVTHDGGISWRVVPLGQGTEPIETAECPSAQTCFALGVDQPTGGSSLFRTTNDGNTWRRLW